MGRTKKLEIEAVIQDSETKEVTTASVVDFELNAEIVAGSLKSNAVELKKAIEKELENYSVEKYLDNPDAAKSDKAFLNKIEKSVSDKRKEIQKKWNEPLDGFLSEMKSLEKSITDASRKLAEITNQAKLEEEQKKRKQIEQYWSTLDFQLVTLDKIFNPRWLNKTFELKDIMLEIEKITEKITSELSTIRSMSDTDSEILQAFYLETLDLNATLIKGNQLKASRETLKKAAEKKQIETPKVEEILQQPAIVTENKPDPIMEYNLILKGPKSKLVMVRKYMESIGVTYAKVEK